MIHFTIIPTIAAAYLLLAAIFGGGSGSSVGVGVVVVHGFAPLSSSLLCQHGRNRICSSFVVLSATVSNATTVTNSAVVDSSSNKEEDDDLVVAGDEPETLLIRLGGEPALEAAVDIFYDRVVTDPSLKSSSAKRIKKKPKKTLAEDIIQTRILRTTNTEGRKR